MTTPLTYSNYSTLHSCGRRFKLQCVDLVPQPRAVALDFGSAMHAGLHDVLVNKDVESAQDVFTAYWCSDTIIGMDWKGERYNHNALAEMGLKFIANFHKRYGKDMIFITGEKRLTGSRDGLLIEGTPDALVEWNGVNTLLDFKTSAYNYLGEKLDCSLQLNLYAHLLEQSKFRVDELAYIVFCKGTGSIQTLDTTDYAREKALALISDAVAYWRRNVGHYEKNPNACIMGKYVCPYFNKCWKEQK